MARDSSPLLLLLLLAGGVAALGGMALRVWIPSRRAELYRPLFEAATRQYGLPKSLLMRVADEESDFNPTARSSKGGVGIMQIVPRWHPEVGEAGALDPARAIPYAAKLLSTWYRQYGSWSLALAAYNAGPGNVDKYGGVPPFPETLQYIANILPDVGIIEIGVRYG